MNKMEAHGHASKTEKARIPGVRIDELSLHDRIAQKAYELYEKRGRLPGWELQDWLEAESTIRGERRQRNGSAQQPVHR